jgi:hypothetical protein
MDLSGENSVKNSISSFFGWKKHYKIQSFTFFIPSPPPRSTGYREKQFDKLFFDFINKGYKILNMTTQASTGEKQSGMWIIVVVQATNREAELLNLEEVFNDVLKNKAVVKEAIEGLYYIDDRASEND